MYMLGWKVKCLKFDFISKILDFFWRSSTFYFSSLTYTYSRCINSYFPPERLFSWPLKSMLNKILFSTPRFLQNLKLKSKIDFSVQNLEYILYILNRMGSGLAFLMSDLDPDFLSVESGFFHVVIFPFFSRIIKY